MPNFVDKFKSRFGNPVNPPTIEKIKTLLIDGYNLQLESLPNIERFTNVLVTVDIVTREDGLLDCVFFDIQDHIYTFPICDMDSWEVMVEDCFKRAER